MKKYINPTTEQWELLCQRPTNESENIDQLVAEVLHKVRTEGDKALQYYTQKFEGCSLDDLKVSQDEFDASVANVAEPLKIAIGTAKDNIETFHRSQIISEPKVETTPGVTCWRTSVPIEKVGLYIPGGTAPLFSTLLMLGIPALLSGCTDIILCTPPRKDGSVDPVILFTANLLGIKKLFKVGGAQAIAALAFGTESIPKVYKIFGPGNRYVTKAKQKVQEEGVAIDMPAGPSEVLIIADETCVPSFVAADLLSQAEHGSDSQVVLVSPREKVIENVLVELDLQIQQLPRKAIAQEALKNSVAIVFADLKGCLDFSNRYAPEHLIIASETASQFVSLISNAGSVFLGNYSCESAGDYASGTNHTLPTNGFAKNYSGVSVDSFCKKITFQELSADGIKNLGPTIEIMAEAEGLQAHKNAVTLRLNSLKQ
jgi:histidinol dehydrogenase